MKPKTKFLQSILVPVIITCSPLHSHASTVFVDHGAYTSIIPLGIDVMDVSTYYGMSISEVEAAVLTLGSGWHLAYSSEVRGIFDLITEQQYLDSVRTLLGSYGETSQGVTRYNTGGWVADTYPQSAHPDFRYFWGFGNGVELYNNQTQQIEYHWTTYGIGMDPEGTRYYSAGAWVIRESVPEPSSFALVGAGFAFLTMRRRS